MFRCSRHEGYGFTSVCVDCNPLRAAPEHGTPAGQGATADALRDAWRLDELEAMFKTCPHAVITWNDDLDREDAAGSVPIGFSIRVDGCSEMNVSATTLRQAIDLTKTEPDEDGNVIATNLATAHGEREPESYWVVERMEDGRSAGYWDGGNSRQFQPDITKAVQYRRRQDALTAIIGWHWKDVVITEHLDIRALATPAKQPEGGEFVLAPRDPTHEQAEAGTRVLVDRLTKGQSLRQDACRNIYRAMLAALPAAAVQDREG